MGAGKVDVKNSHRHYITCCSHINRYEETLYKHRAIYQITVEI